MTPFLFVVIRRNLRHIPKSKPLGAVLLVLSPSGLFCDAPHLTPSNNKIVGYYGICLEFEMLIYAQ